MAKAFRWSPWRLPVLCILLGSAIFLVATSVTPYVPIVSSNIQGNHFSLFPHLLKPDAHTKVPAHAATTDVSVSLSVPIGISSLATGASHTQWSADNGNDPTAVATARSLLQDAFTYQNQPIMGWGADDPEPSPGVYDWASLDERVQLMRSTNATKVITLCCAPGWMRPPGYQDDWSDLETAPAPEHVQDFADLAKLVVQRYPDVHYFLVWNELKGMYSDQAGSSPGIANANRWDYKRYTTLYNAVYDAVKSVRPTAQVGGPYVVMDSDGNAAQMSNPGLSYSWGTLDQRPLDVISYWLKHKHGADFIAVDGSATNKDNVQNVDDFSMAQKFADVMRWIRQQGNGGATLPIWWAEWYAANNPSPSLQHDNALMASDEIYTLLGGADVLLIWGPQGDTQGFSSPEGVWTDTRVQGGGQATPYYGTAQALKTYFPPGTPLYKTVTSSTTLTALASAKVIMLVNRLATAQYVVIDSATIVLQPYEVYLVATPAHANQS